MRLSAHPRASCWSNQRRRHSFPKKEHCRLCLCGAKRECPLKSSVCRKEICCKNPSPARRIPTRSTGPPVSRNCRPRNYLKAPWDLKGSPKARTDPARDKASVTKSWRRFRPRQSPQSLRYLRLQGFQTRLLPPNKVSVIPRCQKQCFLKAWALLRKEGSRCDLLW